MTKSIALKAGKVPLIRCGSLTHIQSRETFSNQSLTAGAYQLPEEREREAYLRMSKGNGKSVSS